MDLEVHGTVLRRYWRLAAVGLLLGIVLALLAYARPTWDGWRPGLEPRDAEVWQSSSTLLLTQSGFPEGRVVPNGDPGRFYGLADIYARVATSDGVMKILRKSGPVNGTVQATNLLSSTSGPSPLIALFGKAPTPGGALGLTRRATRAFVTYLERSQRAAGISPPDRVRVRVLREADPPLLIDPRKKTFPLFVFLAVLSATIALVYVLENVRRRREPTRPITMIPEAEPPEEEPEQVSEPVPTRRWA